MYENRRTESLKIMEETASKRMKISELLDYINGRLHELEEEKEELREYQEKDRERRCLEYAMFERELSEVNTTLDELEDDRRGEVHGVNARREAFNDREKELQARLTFRYKSLLTMAKLRIGTRRRVETSET